LVTVYCRERFTQSSYRGVSLVYLPTWRHKYFDTVVHTFLSTLHLIFHRANVALYCNAANALFTFWPRVTGIPVALNVDGLERKRKKWNWAARSWYLISERLATFCPNVVVTDAQQIADYYLERYGKTSEFIPYGAEVGKLETAEVLPSLGLERNSYFLYVSRMEPENNALLVREAFEKTGTAMKLALIGDAPYAQDYIARVRDTGDPRVVLPGAIYGSGYHELLSHCFAYIHATEVGGTHPALIEAMGRGALVLYLNTPENAEVAGDAGIPFEAAELNAKLNATLGMPVEERASWGHRAAARVAERYSWNTVTDQYEALLLKLRR
jgi:glycosyltransferase involved in cell wall biosynthesis